MEGQPVRMTAGRRRSEVLTLDRRERLEEKTLLSIRISARST
jgi:hypothetical protein